MGKQVPGISSQVYCCEVGAPLAPFPKISVIASDPSAAPTERWILSTAPSSESAHLSLIVTPAVWVFMSLSWTADKSSVFPSLAHLALSLIFAAPAEGTDFTLPSSE